MDHNEIISEFENQMKWALDDYKSWRDSPDALEAISNLANNTIYQLKDIIEELKSDLKEKEDYQAYLPPHLQLVVLTGLPGSGKSSLAIELKKRGFEIVCQDTLGSRKACEEVVKKLMKEGKKCVIDRCNHTNHQRNIWINLMMRFAPRQLNPVALILHLKQNPNVCMQRVLERKGHKTLPPVLSSKSVIDRFALSFEEPSHDRVWVVEDNWIAPLLALAIDLDGAVDMCRRGVSSFKIPTK